MLEMPLLRKDVMGVGLAILAGLSACGPSGADLETEVVAALRTNPEVVDLGSEVAGSWDRLCIAQPYTTQDRLDSLLGFSWHRGARATGIESLDRATLVVFTDSSQVVAYAMVPRREGDFSAATENHCLQRSEAVFRAEVGADGWRQLLPLRES